MRAGPLDQRSLILGTIAFFVLLTFLLFLPHLSLLNNLVTTSNFTFITKLQVVIGLYSSLWSNYAMASAIAIVLTALMFGWNIALLSQLIRSKRSVSLRTSLSSSSGALLGILGVGCVACGSIALTSLLPFIGAGTLIALLPYGGYEIQWLAIVVLVYSGYRLRKELKKPLVCEVTPYA